MSRQGIDFPPFGPFNRIVWAPLGIYMESGLMDLNWEGTRNPDTYRPAEVQFRSQDSTVFGNINLEIVQEDDPGMEFCSIGTVESVLYETTVSDVYESKTVGCSEKVAEVEMVDPRGPGQDCRWEYVTEYIPREGLNPAAAIYADTVVAEGSSFRTKNRSQVRKICKEREFNLGTAVAPDPENPPYCEQSIIYKKHTQVLFPPSRWSGKMRLYIQTIYGGHAVDYWTTDDSKALVVGLRGASDFDELGNAELGENGGFQNRHVTLGRGIYGLSTDGNFNYFLVSTKTWRINPLVPTALGLKFQKYLNAEYNNIGEARRKAYEAYLLSTCAPTTWVDTNLTGTLSLSQYGAPFDFGFNGNWDGDKYAAVMYSRGDNVLRKTSLVEVAFNISTSGITLALETEEDRKRAALRLQTLWAINDPGTPPPVGITRYWATNAKVLNIKLPTECIEGDVNHGAWYYVVEGTPGPTDVDDAASLNARYGGLPLSSECLTDMGNNVTGGSSVLETGEWLERFNFDKLFKWNFDRQMYEWFPPYDPSFDNPADVPGSGPVHCWYASNGQLQIHRYNIRDTALYDNVNIPAQGICGQGSDYTQTQIRSGSGKHAGWIGNSYNTQIYHSDGVITTSLTKSQGLGELEPLWGGGCGLSICSPATPPPGTGVGDHRFFSQWERWRVGIGTQIQETKNGGASYYSFFLFPRDDCEAIFTGVGYTENGTSVQLKDKYKARTGALISIIGEGAYQDRIREPDSFGWIACGSVYITDVWGQKDVSGGFDAGHYAASLNGSFEYFSYHGSISNTNPNASLPSRKWGPDATDGAPTLTSSSPVNIDDISNESSTEDYADFKGNAWWVGKDGTTIQLASVEDSKREPQAVFNVSGGLKWTAFLQFTLPLPVKFPFVQGLYLNSRQSAMEKLAFITSSSDTKRYPSEWNYDDRFVRPVGNI